MTAQRNFAALFALAALLLGGCGGDRLPTAIETDDAVYQQGKQLQRQGRNPEALLAFLKVIEKRGEQFSPESHLEAGLIYLQDIKDPVEAIHHFRKYLTLQRKSKEAPYVRGLIERAQRELAKSLPGRLPEDQSQWLNVRDQLKELQRENDQLRAEAARRGGAAPAPFLRVTQAAVDGNATRLTVAPPAVDEAPIALAPAPSASPGAPLLGKPAAPAKAAGRKHVVALGDTLFSLSRKYGVTQDALAAANREILPPGSTTLKIGAELKIP